MERVVGGRDGRGGTLGATPARGVTPAGGRRQRKRAAPANIFVLGLDELNLETLLHMSRLPPYRFHPLLTVDELLHTEEIPLADLLDKAQRQLESFRGRIDAIIGYWDFPVSSMLPILRRRFGLRGPTLESVVKCEHKYWSRLEQRKVIDEYPRFGLVDLEHPTTPPPGLSYPLWLKPVKSFAAELAFRVGDAEELQRAAVAIREGIGRVGKPFEFVLDQLDLPPEIALIGGQACLAEEALAGTQVTLEGYSSGGDVRIYGVVDSIHYPDSPSFLRYQYPSRLPAQIVDRMAEVARRVIRQVGLEETTFNVEFFWDDRRGTVRLLEVNPRHSQSHARLFADVDGVTNHQCLLSIALGHEPDLPHRQGPHAVAAKWFLRRFTDGVVRRSPTPEEVARLEREIPGTTVKVVAHLGDQLSELPRQDSYSYELANIYIGAADEPELIAKYQRCAEALPFEFDD